MREWAPEHFAVSFKLETDDAILLKKARGAITKYKMVRNPHAILAQPSPTPHSILT